LSCVLCNTADGLESPQDRLDGAHAEGAGHPDKLTVHAGGTGIMQVEHTADVLKVPQVMKTDYSD